MYHALLANRYLTTRLIPLIAVAAVALCVALVIIVVSVMTGFLDMVRSSGRTLMGDVIVSYPIRGIPYYERLIERLEGEDLVHAATPVVDHIGVVRMPYDQTAGIQFWGIEPESFAAVTRYAETLYWDEVSDDQRSLLFGDAIDRCWTELASALSTEQKQSLVEAALDGPLKQSLDALPEGLWRDVFSILAADPDRLRAMLTEPQWRIIMDTDPRLERPEQVRTDGLTLHRGESPRPGIVLGMHVSEANQRNKQGMYDQAGGGYWWMPRFQVTLTTLPIPEAGGLESQPETEILEVVNEFVSGVFVIDDNRVFIPIEVAQRLTHLDAGIRVDPDDPEIELGEDPPRATMVLVRAAEGTTPLELLPVVERAYDAFVEEVSADPAVVVTPPSRRLSMTVRTWEQQQAQLIGPVEKERELMRTLFSIVYVVCAGLVLAIFWAIVYEKTRDIGILRSIGASRVGIAFIFLRYGAVIGVLGAIAGLGLAWLIVRNINAIHAAMGEQAPRWLWIGVLALAGAAAFMSVWKARRGFLLPVVLWSLSTIVLMGVGLGLSLHRGTLIWDPAVYYFSVIPNELDRTTAFTTMIGAVIFSILGAVVPAAKAADTDPVNALRYE
ncbi:MAG: ABC transporter permease [Planctomycetota bacterium]|jgi:lipoprotein-releasing system permease protein